MEQEIKGFVSYLHNVKKTSQNTELSYRRDLVKMMRFLHDQKIDRAEDVTETNLNSYILDLEKKGMSAATVSRNIAAMKGFYLYLWKEGNISADPAENLKAPKVEKKVPDILSIEEMARLLEQPGDRTPKGLRDRAMLELPMRFVLVISLVSFFLFLSLISYVLLHKHYLFFLVLLILGLVVLSFLLPK